MATGTAIYCRISDDRASQGLGVERQRQDCEDLARRRDLSPADLYIDNDVSAYNGKRRVAYQRLVADIEAGDVTTVLVYMTSRLWRSRRERAAGTELFMQRKVRVLCVKGPDLDFSTAAGRMVGNVLGEFDTYESDVKSERVLRKARELADAGKVGNGGPRPFGYEPDRITVRDDEADLLREAYRDVLVGKGLATICKDWHARGVKTTQGGTWSPQTLKPCLLRARNMGWREHKGRLAAVAVWDPIVDEETWRQVKAILTSPSRTSGGVPFVRKYLLTGLLRCGLCGAKLVPHRAKDEVQRFACHRVAAKDNCGRIGIVYGPAEEMVTELVLRRLTEAGQQVDPERPADPTDALREEIAEREGSLVALADAFVGERGDALAFRRATQGIQQQIADLRQQINAAAATQRLADPVKVRDAWPDYDVHQRRAVLEHLVERIDIGPAVRGRNYFDKARVRVVWR